MESFSYSDNGISLSVNLAQGYQSMAQMMLTGYTQLKKDVKRAMRPHAAGIHSSPSPVRIRSYAPRNFFLIMLRNACAIIKKFIIESPLNGGTLSNKLRQLAVVNQY